ncbi:hypothetical protein OSTOST_17391, partial [Ostertagia ostertagi]
RQKTKLGRFADAAPFTEGFQVPGAAEEQARAVRDDDIIPKDQPSPVSSAGSPWDQSGMSQKSSGFDIRSIPEMVNKPNLSQWYEEQLSFMKESIADEEDEMYRPSEAEHEPSPVLQEEYVDEDKYIEEEPRPLVSPEQAHSSVTIESAEKLTDSPTSAPASIVARGRTEAGIDRTSSAAAAVGGMLDSSQGGRFRLSGLGKFASGALGKAKQAAADFAQNVPATTTKLTVGNLFIVFTISFILFLVIMSLTHSQASFIQPE